MKFFLPGLIATLFGASAQPLSAQQVDFAKEVYPVLESNCFKCHGGKKVKGGLHLDSRAGIMKGGDSGKAVDLKRPTKSLLFEAINYELEG